MTQHINPLWINVGFIVKADAGYSRTFDFELPEVFLAPDLSLNDLVGTARFSRTPQGLVMDVFLSARTPGECARCLDPVDQAIATQFTELYAFNERSATESQLILPANHQIDLAPLVREYMILDMPMNPLCQKDCQGLCPVCGINRNHENCDHVPSDIDPRLATLKDLLDPQD
ncbi:MAG: DUF177 domain-containing protein [Chloroflexi bacterium]|nr:DUF177 domain-containing protein [Chloroflexota bacterium]